MSKFSEYFIRNYPHFKDDILNGRYERAISEYVVLYKKKVGRKKKKYINPQQEYSAAFDGFNRHGSHREQDLRALVNDDKAFDDFLDFFKQRYGKDGIYRVSNKAKDVGTEKNYMVKLKQFLRRIVKVSSWDKDRMFEETKRYIYKSIISQWSDIIAKKMHKKLVQKWNNLSVSLFFMNEIEEYRRFAELFEFEGEIAKSCFSGYLLWHSARYINRKVDGKNIPTNKLTKLLKNNPFALEFLDKAEQKHILRSFRLQKRFCNAELDNALSVYHSLYDKYDDISLEIKIPDPVSFRRPDTLDEAKKLITYRNKVISFLDLISSGGQLLDKRRAFAVEKIIRYKSPFKMLTQQQKAYIDSLPKICTSEKKECVKAIDRIIGIYTFCAREKYMNRESYYKEYFNSISPSQNKGFLKKKYDNGLDIFILKKKIDMDRQWKKTFYNFNTGKYEEYISYIDAVQKLYPMDEYIYIIPYQIDSKSGDEYVTEDGYTLARYNIKGELSPNLLAGNYVRPIVDSVSISDNDMDLGIW